MFRTRRDFLEAKGVLLITRAPATPAPSFRGQPAAIVSRDGLDIFIAIRDDGRVSAMNGHVDLGTGVKTALAQIVAEELDISLAQVDMLLGDTAGTPNQGATIASSTIQLTAIPLRKAAAQARAYLLGAAARQLGVDAARLVVNDGVITLAATSDPGDSVSGDKALPRIAYADLVRSQHIELSLDEDTPVKAAVDYRLVGQSSARLDIPDKATGELVYVHDLRVPGMLFGSVVRPPYGGADHGAFFGNSLIGVDRESIAHLPGIVEVLVIRDFVGIVAQREEIAMRASRELVVHWRTPPDLPDLNKGVEQAIRDNPRASRRLVDQGDVDAVMASGATPMSRTYVWPYQMHASIGPSCAVADWREQSLTVWSGTQNPINLRLDLSRLMGLPETDIDLIRMEAAGCYGRNCADDVTADAALLSRAVGAPVRVQLTREQENVWEPKGSAQLMDIDGALAADGSIAAYHFQTSYPSNGAPTLALLLTGTDEAVGEAYEMGDRTSVPPYAYPNLRVTVHDMAPIVRASWLRGVSALPNSFAHESYIDEMAVQAGVDPVEYRLRSLTDTRAIDLVRDVAAKAQWQPRAGPPVVPPHGDMLYGRGFAYARYVHSRFPGFGAAWSAWVADVAVNRVTGEVSVTKVVVGQDAGLMINPAGVRHQVHGNVLQSTSRSLKEKVEFDTRSVVSREWGAYPLMSFRDVPVVEVVLPQRADQPPLGSGESASVPSTAAIANAIYDATGVRFREPPFTPEVVRAALNAQRLGAASVDNATAPGLPALPFALPASSARGVFERPTRHRLWTAAAATLATGLVATGAAWTLRAEIAPTAPPAAGFFSEAAISRGKVLAQVGDCAVCHTAPGGQVNAGGLPLPTPFGTVYSTNITPDVETGIGNWSFSAFQRAMREGIHRDGRHLYPAFPYTAFTKVTDTDLMDLYAHLMSRPAVSRPNDDSRLSFPFNLRPLIAGWNALFLRKGPQAPAAMRSETWNRGAYLVEGLGHCGACHTPRNAAGAEKKGASIYAGAMIEGWEAPALTALSHSPIAWTESDFFDYLRTGYSDRHGVAAGPMAAVVREMTTLPDADVRAMAVYLASFNEGRVATDAAAATHENSTETSTPAALIAASRASAPAGTTGANLFNGACGACHHDGDGPVLFGINPPLALNSNLHSSRPDNLLQVILNGIQAPADPSLGFMPAFKDSLTDRQLAELTMYLRARYAPQREAWTGLPQAIARVRGR